MDIYQEISAWYDAFRGEKRVIGKSFLSREIYAVKIGGGKPCAIAQYAVHGREWITAKLATYHAEKGVKKGSVWILPLVNPDGALISQTGLSSVADKKAKKFLKKLCPRGDFSLWKANGRGVDLNVNFPADWGKGEKNVFFPSSENYVGEYPCSEKETDTLRRFTQEISPQFTVSYHTKGEEIYWYYYQSLYACARDKKMAAALSDRTGYPLKFAKGSVGGYKDWCIKSLKIPSFTVEVGKDSEKHPLNEKQLKNIIEKDADDLDVLIAAYEENRL